MKTTRAIAAGAGFAGDRIDQAVRLAASGQVDSIVLECLAERTILPRIGAFSVRRSHQARPFGVWMYR